MSTVEEIIAAIERLPAEEVSRLRAWLAESNERRWDEQIDRDEKAGRLGDLVQQTLQEHHEGRTRPL